MQTMHTRRENEWNVDLCQQKMSDEETKTRIWQSDREANLRRLLHEPFKDLDAYLTDAEMHELNECKSQPDGPAVQHELQRLLGVATERRIEAHIDELLDRDDDVMV